MPEYNLGTVKGADGKGIQSIVKTGTSGLVDTYTITYTNGDTQTYTVTNGKDGEGGADIVTEWEQTLSDEKIPSEKLTKTTIDTKVDKVTGKGLSENDFTDTLKDKLDGIEAQANKYVHPSSKQCNATIPSASTSTPSADVSGGAIGSSSDYAKADHQHPLSSAYATAGHTHSGMLTTSDIADNLTTDSSTKVLSAKQGKALADLIGDAISYINQ